MVLEEVRKDLLKIGEEEYSKFTKKLCPDTKKEIIGIRIPILRKISKEYVKNNNYEEYLKEALKIKKDKYLEETIMQGFIISYANFDIDQKLNYIKKFIPKIDSWEVTDTFIPTLKIRENDLEKVWDFIIPYTKSDKEFYIRFAVIMMLNYYINDNYVCEVIKEIDKIKTNNMYYSQMAIAWTLAEIGVKYNDKLMKYLNSENNLDKFTYNKTLQKMIESYRITSEQKQILKGMKK